MGKNPRCGKCELRGGAILFWTGSFLTGPPATDQFTQRGPSNFIITCFKNVLDTKGLESALLYLPFVFILGSPQSRDSNHNLGLPLHSMKLIVLPKSLQDNTNFRAEASGGHCPCFRSRLILERSLWYIRLTTAFEGSHKSINPSYPVLVDLLCQGKL